MKISWQSDENILFHYSEANVFSLFFESIIFDILHSRKNHYINTFDEIKVYIKDIKN